MKELKELGISQVPWNEREWSSNDAHFAAVEDNKELTVCRLDADDNCCSEMKANARLIAATPLLYDCLYEAVSQVCFECECETGDHQREECYKDDTRHCYVKRWIVALKKAGGEE